MSTTTEPSARVGPGTGVVPAPTVTVRPCDVPVAPLLSVATAVNTYDPTGTALHVMAYGAVLSDPIRVAPAKKSTRLTVPSVSLALALIATVAGARYVAPDAGAVNDAAGELLGAAA